MTNMARRARAAAAGLAVATVWMGLMPSAGAVPNRAAGNLRLAVIVYNQPGVLPAILSRAQGVAAGIYRRIGIDTTWHDGGTSFDETLPADPEARDAALMSVITVTLAPTVGSLDRGDGLVLGRALTGTRSATVFYDRVVTFAKAGRVEVADLLGHVIAHEVGHLLLPFKTHSRTGLMRANLDLSRCAEGSLWFSAEQGAAIRAKLAEGWKE
jgi:hypothetical protein